MASKYLQLSRTSKFSILFTIYISYVLSRLIEPLQNNSDFAMGSDEEANRQFIFYDPDEYKENVPPEEHIQIQNVP